MNRVVPVERRRYAIHINVIKKPDECCRVSAGYQPADQGRALTVEDSLTAAVVWIVFKSQQFLSRPSHAAAAGSLKISLMSPLFLGRIEEQCDAFVGPAGGRSK